MNFSKPDSVQGFLTPTKLLSSIAKQPPKPKYNLHGNRSMASPSPRNKQKFIIGGSTTRERHSDTRREQESYQQPKAISLLAGHQNNFLDQTDHRKQGSDSQHSNSRKRNVPLGMDLYSEQESKERHDQREYGNEKQNLHGSRGSRESAHKSSSNSHVTPTPQINSLHSKELIHKLQTLKKSLEYEISHLQSLLDDTSTQLHHIDQEYEKLKENILRYTANYLDSAFNDYKKHMDWIRYQQYQKNGLQMLTEINQIIVKKQQELQIHHSDDSADSFRREQRSLQQVHAINRDLQAKIDYYGGMIINMESIRKQCLEMRPTITEQRLKRFQEAVIELGKF